MAEMNVEQVGSQGNLFLPVSDAMLAEVIDEARKMGRLFPEILERISEDQDRVGLKKKQLRWEQQAWIQRQTEPLPGIEKNKEY